jgi:transcriptional regulator with XRE-family HTH domain/ketosteroid isomerase-like protein
MIQQPELGKKIIDLRKAKGLTQEELVEKCNLSVRTLQRIEAGEVTPRPSTVKLIFEALEVSFNLSKDYKSSTSKWLRQFYHSLKELFNLKTNTMKKISLLSITIGAIVLGLFMFYTDSMGQSVEEVQRFLNSKNVNIVRWFNSGMTDSVAACYSENACILGTGVPKIYGKEAISAHYKDQYSKGYKLLNLYSETVNVGGNIAVERGVWIIQVDHENRYKGNFLTEWHFIDGSWLIVNDIGCVEKKLE